MDAEQDADRMLDDIGMLVKIPKSNKQRPDQLQINILKSRIVHPKGMFTCVPQL